jgi:hypothetical protein
MFSLTASYCGGSGDGASSSDLCAYNQTGDKDGDEHQDTGL